MSVSDEARGSGRGQGWWKGIRAWWQRLFQPASVPSDWPGFPPADGRGELVTLDSEVDGWSFTTPALGDAHEFSVQAHCSWSVSRTALSAEEVEDVRRELHTILDTARVSIKRRVEDEVRHLARQYPPYRAAEAEQDIGRQIETCMSDGEVRCRITLRIDVADAVRKELQAFWSQRMELDMNLDHSQHKAKRIHEVQQAWATVLSSGLTDLEASFGVTTHDGVDTTTVQPWMAPYALLLAEQPVEVAQVMDGMLAKRIGQGRELLADLAKVVRQHKEVDAYDVAVRSDVALRNVLQGLGVPVPQQLLADIEE
jgi:hypothetical protein